MEIVVFARTEQRAENSQLVVPGGLSVEKMIQAVKRRLGGAQPAVNGTKTPILRVFT